MEEKMLKLSKLLLSIGLFFIAIFSFSLTSTAQALLGEGMTVYIQCGGNQGDGATLARTNGARDAARHFGVRLIEQYSSWQQDTMIKHMKEAMAANPTGIVIMGHPGEGAFTRLVKEANGRGIIVTSGNTPLPGLQMKYGGSGFGYAGVILYDGGALTAQNMITRGNLQSGDKVMVYGLLAQGSRGESTRGMIDTLKRAGMNVIYQEISAEVNADSSLAAPIITAFVAKNPDLKAIGTQHGAITSVLPKILKRMGKKPGDIVIGGIDLSPPTIAGLKSKYISATLDQQLYLQGFLPVTQIVLSKKYGFAGLTINTGAGVVTPETIEELTPLIEAGIR
jgi:simple sugar transport system substrate-binding protein